MVNVGTFNFNNKGQLLVAPLEGATNVVRFHMYDEASIASGATTTIVTYTVPVGKNVLINHFTFSGYADGRAVLEIGGTNEYALMNSAAERSPRTDLSGGILISASTVINVKITNNGGSLQSFDSCINGFQFDEL
jgi:hypothetical protein